MARHLAYLDRAVTETITGTQRRLIIAEPPRHGKSEYCSKYLPAWFLGNFPDRRVILASYEADFAASWGRKARTLLEECGGLFGVRVSGNSSAADRWDIEGHAGGMMTAGVGGPLTGKGADILVVDDAIKNAEEAASTTYREKMWDWFRSVAYTRLEPGGIVLVIATRWHEDDLTGRILQQASELGAEKWRLINLPAIAEASDLLGRQPGEALWPERFPVADLMRIKKALGSYLWSALYQQRPAPLEGGMFKRQWFHTVPDVPAEAVQFVRYWDKAGTEGAGAYTAGVLMCLWRSVYYVVNVVRGQWSAGERERIIQETTELDVEVYCGGERGRYEAWCEQEPGSGGKESAELTIKALAGYNVHTERPTGDKETRARPFAAQCEAGNVRLVQGPWNREYVEEHCLFPAGKYKDQVDASSGAFNKLALAPARKKLQVWL